MPKKKSSEKEDLKHLIAKQSGIQLDIGCGASKTPGFIGIDFLDLPGVDIVHDLQKTPWPLEDNSVIRAIASHVVEHIDPTPPDSRLISLIKLLQDKKLISEREVQEHLGELTLTPRFIAFMNEVWRVMKPDGEFIIATPYAGSLGYWQDPSHCNPCNEFTWEYFDPIAPITKGAFYQFYQPKPWRIKTSMHSKNGNMELILVKRLDDPSYHGSKPGPLASMGMVGVK